MVVCQRGSHVLFKHPDGRVVVVPKHRGVILPGLMRRIMRDAVLGEDAFR